MAGSRARRTGARAARCLIYRGRVVVMGRHVAHVHRAWCAGRSCVVVERDGVLNASPYDECCTVDAIFLASAIGLASCLSQRVRDASRARSVVVMGSMLR